MNSKQNERLEMPSETKDLKSPSKPSEASKQDSTKNQDKMLRANAKMIFLATIEVANRFRTIFDEKDHEGYHQALIDNYMSEAELVPNISREAKRKRNRDILNMVARYKQQNEQMSNMLINYAQGHLGGINKDNLPKVMEVIDTLYLLTIELNRSKSPSQMLSVCQLYNSGYFDKVFEEKDRLMEKQGLSVPTGIVDASGNKITSKG